MNRRGLGLNNINLDRQFFMVNTRDDKTMKRHKTVHTTGNDVNFDRMTFNQDSRTTMQQVQPIDNRNEKLNNMRFNNSFLQHSKQNRDNRVFDNRLAFFATNKKDIMNRNQSNVQAFEDFRTYNNMDTKFNPYANNIQQGTITKFKPVQKK